MITLCRQTSQNRFLVGSERVEYLELQRLPGVPHPPGRRVGGGLISGVLCNSERTCH